MAFRRRNEKGGVRPFDHETQNREDKFGIYLFVLFITNLHHLYTKLKLFLLSFYLYLFNTHYFNNI